VLDPEGAAGVARRQDDEQRADHAVASLGVLVRLEELPGSIDRQLVEPSLQRARSRQPELLADFLELCAQNRIPAATIDSDSRLGDLPAVTHVEIGDRPISPPER
jgi:hypothetical protein